MRHSRLPTPERKCIGGLEQKSISATAAHSGDVASCEASGRGRRDRRLECVRRQLSLFTISTILADPRRSNVADAISSVLLQEGAAFELIVIDDGSTDATPAILARYNDSIILHRQSNLGEGAARNAAIPYLGGDLVLFLDADDLIPAGFLNRFGSAAREAPKLKSFTAVGAQ
jgi:cellulose synthase/poly-beta-1,6-N-acetylglucosamine synthase-like glycosyltransferase